MHARTLAAYTPGPRGHRTMLDLGGGPGLIGLAVVASILSTAMLGHDPAFDQGQVAGSMRRAGFRSVDSRTLETGVGPMDLDIARK